MESRIEESASAVDAGKASPLADLFPGKTVVLRDGKVIKMGKWTARQVVHEVPALLGRVLVQLSTLVKAGLASDGEMLAATLITDAASEVLALLAMTARLELEYVESLDADEFVMLVGIMIEENMGFFEQIAKIYELGKTRLGSHGTPSQSS